MEIYVDIILAENFIINYFLLYLTGKFIKINLNWKRILFGTILGTTYTMVLFIENNFLRAVPMKILVPMLMIYIVFGKCTIKRIFEATVIFMGLSFVFAGLAFAMAIASNSGSTISFTDDNFSVKWLLISMIIISLVVKRLFEFLKDRAVIKNFIYDIYITIGEKSLLLRGFLDTGNELREPITNLPCIIIEEHYMDSLSIDKEEKLKIGFQTIDGNGIIDGVRIKEIKIKNNSSNEWTSIEAVVCSCSQKLSKENDYEALLSRGIV